MKNTLLEEFEDKLKRDKQFLKAIKKQPQLYYYQIGNCIYERLYNNNDYFEMRDPFGGVYTKSEKELIELKAEKIYYEQ